MVHGNPCDYCIVVSPLQEMGKLPPDYCPRDTIICVMERGRHHYAWSRVPHHQRTEKQLLKRRRRLKKNARPPKHVEPVPTEECERLRRKLQLFGPDAAGQCALYCLDRAGELVTCNLYDLADILRDAVARCPDKPATEAKPRQELRPGVLGALGQRRTRPENVAGRGSRRSGRRTSRGRRRHKNAGRVRIAAAADCTDGCWKYLITCSGR